MQFIFVCLSFSSLVSAVLQTKIPVYEACPSDYTTFPLTCTRGCGKTLIKTFGCIGCTDDRSGCHGDCYQNKVIDCFNHPAHTISRKPTCPQNFTFSAGLCYRCDNTKGLKKCLIAGIASGVVPGIAKCALAGAATVGATCAISALAIGGAAAGCVISQC